MDNTELTAQAAYNEVKKMERFLDALARLKPVLEVVANQERKTDELRVRAEALEAVVARKEDEAAVISVKVDELKAKLEGMKASFEAKVKELKEKENSLLSETSAKVEVLKNSALASVEKARMELAELQPKVAELKKIKYTLEEDVAKIKAKADMEAKKVVEAWRKLGV